MTDSTFMHELNDGAGATVDARLVPLIKFLNRLNVTTESTYIDAHMVTVTFFGEYPTMADLLFKHFKEMFGHIDGVRLEMSWRSKRFLGSVWVPLSSLDEVSSRIGIWLEMLRK